MRNGFAKKVALGGMLAALAVTIMSVGGLIPVATYVSAVLCAILGYMVWRICGGRIAWAWYGTVSVLSLLLSPDKESAAVYLFLGYYPIIKVFFDNCRFGFLLKLLYFNSSVTALYIVLIYLIGMEQIVTDYRALGMLGLIVMLILGNIAFLLLDHVLFRISKKR